MKFNFSFELDNTSKAEFMDQGKKNPRREDLREKCDHEWMYSRDQMERPCPLEGFYVEF